MTQQAIYKWRASADQVCTVRCSWECRDAMPHDQPYPVGDLLVEIKEGQADPFSAPEGNISSCDANSKLCGLLDAILSALPEASHFAIPAKIILAPFDGYAVQEDIIKSRFADSIAVAEVHRIADWTMRTKAVPLEVLPNQSLSSLLDSAAAVVIGYPAQPSQHAAAFDAVDEELRCRLQLQWWQPHLPPMRRLAIVMVGGTWRFYGPVYQAATENRISLVVIDEPDHWLNDPLNRGLYEHFLPLSLNNDDGHLHTRIADTLRKSGLIFDGITCHNDQRVVAVAQAAAALGLPTQPAYSYLTCRDKHETHRLRPAGLLNKLVTTEEQANTIAKDSSMQFPLIVKPRSGWHSDGVVKVTEPSQILPAVTNILSELHDHAMVETYINGPEIDVNLVICERSVLFSEVADNAPGEGDGHTKDPASGLRARGFAETVTASPSALPTAELAIAQESALKAVIEAGFSSGVFHVEGRLMHSSMHYERVDDRMELRPNTEADAKDAMFVLIEINARPPGLPVSFAAKRTYGVDYYAQLMFMALDDRERMQILTAPYAYPGLSGAQYWTHTQFPLAPYGGHFDLSEWTHMMASHAQACRNVSIVDALWEDGQEILDPSNARLRALAYLVMYSRESRRRLEDVVADVLPQLQPYFATRLVRKAEATAGSDSGVEV